MIPWERVHVETLCYLVLLSCALSSSGGLQEVGGHRFHPSAPTALTGDLLCQVPALTAPSDPEPLPSRQERGRPQGFQWPLADSELGLP